MPAWRSHHPQPRAPPDPQLDLDVLLNEIVSEVVRHEVVVARSGPRDQGRSTLALVAIEYLLSSTLVKVTFMPRRWAIRPGAVTWFPTAHAAVRCTHLPM